VSQLPTESLLTPEARQRLVAALTAHAKGLGVDAVERHDAKRLGGGGYYDRGAKRIGAHRLDTDDGVHSLAHEVGHADFDQGLLGSIVQSPIARAGSVMGLGIGAIVALVAEGSMARRVALASGAAAAVQLPMLTSEAMASIRGHELLKAHGAPQEFLDAYKKDLWGSFQTYLPDPMFHIGGAAVAGALSHAYAPG
jgi:hypothetical protein